MEEAVDEAFVEEAARAMEVIIGADDRVHIKNTTDIPWRRVCALRITFPSGSTYRGTGFLIGARAVATAGHCVFLHNQGGWARKVEVIPGCNGTSRPYGQAESTSFRSVAGWVTNKAPESDYGCIVLPSGAFGGRNLGSFGCANFDAAKLVAQPAVLGGYPGDKPFAELWGMSRIIKAVTAKTLVYDIDTVGGQSGAPVYIKRAGQRYVVGIHNYGAAAGNSATRVTEPVYQRLLTLEQALTCQREQRGRTDCCDAATNLEDGQMRGSVRGAVVRAENGEPVAAPPRRSLRFPPRTTGRLTRARLFPRNPTEWEDLRSMTCSKAPGC